jgi:predicted nucleic acid-binding protein
VFLVDTSTWARKRQPALRERLANAIEDVTVAITPLIALELLRSARSARDLAELAEEYDSLHQVRLTDDIVERAREVQALLAARGHHRGPSPIDLLTAAAAESIDAVLWHCDRHFELIAKATGQKEERLG